VLTAKGICFQDWEKNQLDKAMIQLSKQTEMVSVLDLWKAVGDAWLDCTEPLKKPIQQISLCLLFHLRQYRVNEIKVALLYRKLMGVEQNQTQLILSDSAP